MSKINKITSSLGKSKSLRNLAIATALFGVMTATQSCWDKNKGMPVRSEKMDLSVKSNTDQASEAIKINNNKVSLTYVTDGDIEWKQKEITYTLELDRHKDGKITVHLKGDTYFGTDGENTVKLDTDFTYESIEEFNEQFPDKCGEYLDNAMADLKKEEDQFKGEDEQASSEYDSEFSSKTEMLTGWLKYYTNNKYKAQENPVQKEGDVVTLPIKRNGNKFDFKIKQNETKAGLESKTKEKSKIYDITINGKTTAVPLAEDPLVFAQELTDYVEWVLKVGTISNKHKTENFFGKCLEVNQLLND